MSDDTDLMTARVVEEFGDPNAFTKTLRPEPIIEPDEVLITVSTTVSSIVSKRCRSPSSLGVRRPHWEDHDNSSTTDGR